MGTNEEDQGIRLTYRPQSSFEALVPAPGEEVWDPELNTEQSSPIPVQELKVQGFSGEYVLPATHLPFGNTGPGVWMVNDEAELVDGLYLLLTDALQRRSRGHAAAQGAARLVIGLILEVWNALDEGLFDEVLFP